MECDLMKMGLIKKLSVALAIVVIAPVASAQQTVTFVENTTNPALAGLGAVAMWIFSIRHRLIHQST